MMDPERCAHLNRAFVEANPSNAMAEVCNILSLPQSSPVQKDLIFFLGPEFQKLDLGVSSCYEIGRRVFTGAQALYVSFARLGI